MTRRTGHRAERRSIGWLILAGLCFVGGALLAMVYPAVRFTGFLCGCAGGALVLFYGLDQWSRQKRAGFVAKRIFMGLLAAGFALFAVLEVWILSWARTDKDTDTVAMVVFGAGVNGTVPSLSLTARLEAALAYANERPNIPIVVSGCQGPGEDISEARCMADWLTARNIPAERILLEEQARDTRENVAYSLALLEENGVDTTQALAFCTSDYHICRTAYLRGSRPIAPVAATLPNVYWPVTVNYYMREAFALAAEMVFPGG